MRDAYALNAICKRGSGIMGHQRRRDPIDRCVCFEVAAELSSTEQPRVAEALHASAPANSEAKHWDRFYSPTEFASWGTGVGRRVVTCRAQLQSSTSVLYFASASCRMDEGIAAFAVSPLKHSPPVQKQNTTQQQMMRMGMMTTTTITHAARAAPAFASVFEAHSVSTQAVSHCCGRDPPTQSHAVQPIEQAEHECSVSQYCVAPQSE